VQPAAPLEDEVEDVALLVVEDVVLLVVEDVVLLVDEELEVPAVVSPPLPLPVTFLLPALQPGVKDAHQAARARAAQETSLGWTRRR
jgi:hypothetical protein